MQTYEFQYSSPSDIADNSSFSVRYENAADVFLDVTGTFLEYDGTKLDSTSYGIYFRQDRIVVENRSGASWNAGIIVKAAITYNVISPESAIPARLSSRTKRTCLAVGDSITAQAETILAATSTTLNADGSVTVVRTSHALGVGQPVRVGASRLKASNLMDAVVTRVIDANTIVCAGGTRRHPVTGSSPSLVFPLRRSSRGFLTWLETLAGDDFDYTWCATGGATIGEMTELVRETPFKWHDFAVVCGGMNNIYSDHQELAEIKQEMRVLMQEVKQRAATIIVLSVPPRNSVDTASGAWTETAQGIHVAFNDWLYHLCRESGAKFVDTWIAKQDNVTYVNASAGKPDITASMAFDNTHPSARGGLAIGTAIYNAMPSEFWNPRPSAAHSYMLGANAGNLWTDGDFSTNTAGIATGWTVSSSTTGMIVSASTGARTVTADGDAMGYYQELKIQYGSASGTASTRFGKLNIQASLTPGRLVQAQCKFSVTAAKGLLALELAFSGTTAGGFWFVYGQSLDSNADPLSGEISGTIITPPAIVPDGLSDLDIWIRPYLSSAQSAPCFVRIWQPKLYYVDAL